MHLTAINPCCRRMTFSEGGRSERWFYSGHHFDPVSMETRNEGRGKRSVVILGDSFADVEAKIEAAHGVMWNMGADSSGVCDAC